MHIMRRRGWELPEHMATPEHLFFDRRAFLLATGGAAAATMLPAADAFAQRAADAADTDRGALSGEAQRDLQARPAGHRRNPSIPPTIISTSSAPPNRSRVPPRL